MARRAVNYAFPHYKPPRLRVRQPDYAKWCAVEFGMTRTDVIAFLSKPLRDPYLSSGDSYWSYGYLEFPMTPHLRTYQFLIGFDDDSKVVVKEDPFGGVFSPDGVPSKPMIFTPPEGTAFRHYPRLVDMRWQPVSGVYPIHYEIEIGSAGYDEERDAFIFDQDNLVEENLPFPYYVHKFVGDNPGRFRVRGVNKLGAGGWSEYRHFDFSAAD